MSHICVKNCMERLERLEVYSRTSGRDLHISAEFYARAQKTFQYITSAFDYAKTQFKLVNLPVLESVIFKLRDLFTSLGCDRLSYLFECIFENLSLTRLKVVEGLLDVGEHEIRLACKAWTHQGQSFG
ncbi:MAG: hypothetical protein HRU19_33030 [Pseudobacteriovorax sp.]|nr:hypothetical protein [Pseudobacteriovorax sp.]